MARPWISESGLYAIIDPEHCSGRDPTEIARRVLDAPCAVVQLRDKRGHDGAAWALAEELHAICDAAHVPFVINDRVDMASLLNADGVHLGQEDLDVAEAKALDRELIVGVSTHTLAQAKRAEAHGADLIGFGPVFDTRTKANPDATVGLDQLAEVCASVAIPVVAIGGIDPERAPSAYAAGARFVAVISALCGAKNPASVARALQP